MAVRPTILFAEDSSDDVELIRIGFEGVNFPSPLQFVEDGLVAVDYFEGRKHFADRSKYPLPSVLLTDLMMPRMDGFALITWIRARKEFKLLPIIVMTGSNRSSDRQRAMELGANAYVTKSLFMRPPASLVEEILRYCDTPSAPVAEPDRKKRRPVLRRSTVW